MRQPYDICEDADDSIAAIPKRLRWKFGSVAVREKVSLRRLTEKNVLLRVEKTMRYEKKIQRYGICYVEPETRDIRRMD